MISLVLLAASALGGTGRLAVGLDAAAGTAPAEPSWTLPYGVGSDVVCAGLSGWWITGGHDYAGPRGEVLRTADDRRWGIAAQACPTGDGGTQGALGGGFGRQWGGQLYFAATSTVGLSVFHKEVGVSDTGQFAYWSPAMEPHRYTAVAPYVKPKVAVGFVAPPGLSFEVGPYLYVAPPLLQITDQRPSGSFVGHIGLELSVLVGAASPTVPWAK